jgi:ribosome-binding factor A
MTRKQEEISELLRREISSIILHELSDPRTGFVTVTHVRIAGDYQSARVFVTVRGSEEDLRRTLKALTHARGHIQSLIARRIKLRHTPVLEFVEDRDVRKAQQVDRLIDRVTEQETGPES